MPTRVRSHAKINLGLAIGPPRPDGFHGLTTVYQTLEAHDVVTVAARPAAATSIRLTSNDQRVPSDSRNTAWKMILLALDELRVTADVSIHIEKRLPVQGGLGAGSANAVAALVGLEHELGIAAKDRALPPFGQTAPEGWGTRVVGLEHELGIAAKDRALPPFGQKAPEGWGTRVVGLEHELGIAAKDRALPPFEQKALEGWGTGADQAETGADWARKRMEIAAQVGSDVPLFLVGGTVLGLDRGQQVYALPDLEPLWCVLAIPRTGVSTPQAFRDWDALCAAEGLTGEAGTDKLNRLSRAYLSAFGVETPGEAMGQSSSGVLSTKELDREDLAEPSGFALVRTGITSWIQNDFERVVFPQHPSLAEIKRILAAPATPEAAAQDSCLWAALSGSGSALFGLYKARGDAEAAIDRLGQVRGVEARMTRTMLRSEYWSGMILE